MHDIMQVTALEAQALEARGVEVIYSISREDFSRLIANAPASKRKGKKAQKRTYTGNKPQIVFVKDKSLQPQKGDVTVAVYDLVANYFADFKGTRPELVDTLYPYLATQYRRQQVHTALQMLLQKGALKYINSNGEAA